jgi:hypothetical protein
MCLSPSITVTYRHKNAAPDEERRHGFGGSGVLARRSQCEYVKNATHFDHHHYQRRWF